MMRRVQIRAMASALPETCVSSAEVERRVGQQSGTRLLVPGSVQAVTGVQTRRHAAEGVNTSDLAAAAARRVLDKTGTPASAVDLLIFASASQDLLAVGHRPHHATQTGHAGGGHGYQERLQQFP